jgi:hypothetical protein
VKGPKPKPIAERFWSKVDLDGPGGCWLWRASVNNHGYGTFYLSPDRRHAYAHRVAYELLVGPADEAIQLDHTCHTPACVNPVHLRPATHRLNAQNKSGPPANNKSGYLGVYFESRTGRWCAQVKHRGKVVYHARFADKEQAGAAAAEARRKIFTYNILDRM